MAFTFLWFIVIGVLLLTLGDLVLRFLESKAFHARIPAAFRFAIAFHLVPIIGYFFFWAYKFNLRIGVILSSALFAALAAALVYQAVKLKKILFLEDDEAKWQAALTFSLPLIFLLPIALPYASDRPAPTQDQRIIDYLIVKKASVGASDYLIQWLYGECDSPWNWTLCPYKTSVSDRPPVIGGTAFMLKTPYKAFRKPKRSVSIPQFLGTAVFCCAGWIPAVWSFLRAFNLSRKKTYYLIILLAFGPLFFVNTTYCWPKMPGATYMILGLLLADPRYRLRESLGKWTILLSATFVGFSLLNHLANVMTVPFLLLLLIIKKEIRVRELLVCGGIVAIILASWYVPKKIYEEPHPSLVRYLFTNAKNSEVFFNSPSDWQAFKASYKNMSWGEIVDLKVRNFQESLSPFTAGLNPFAACYNVFLSPGVFLIGAAGVGFFASRRMQKELRSPHTAQAAKFLGIFIACYLLLAATSYCFPPCTTLFPTSASLLYVLALALLATFLAEKTLAILANLAFLLWAYLFFENGPFLAVVLVWGILLAVAMRMKRLLNGSDQPVS